MTPSGGSGPVRHDDATESAARHANPVGVTPVESIMAVRTVRRAVWVGPTVVAVTWLMRGMDGALAAAIGVGVIVGNFLLAGALLSGAARVSLAAYHAAALFGFFLRLGLIMGTMLLIVRLIDLDRLSFGLAAIVSYMVLLILESVALSRGRERDLDWTN